MITGGVLFELLGPPIGPTANLVLGILECMRLSSPIFNKQDGRCKRKTI